MNVFPPNPARCPLCGDANECQLCTPGASKGPCWCAHKEIPAALLKQVPAESRNRACICRHCVNEFESDKTMASHLPPQPTRRAPA